jgi:hypothetical protein
MKYCLRGEFMATQQEMEAQIAALEAMLTGQGMEVEKVQVPAPPEVVDLAPVGHPEPRDPIVNPPYDSDLAPVTHPEPLTPVLYPPQELAPVNDGRVVDVYRVKSNPASRAGAETVSP